MFEMYYILEKIITNYLITQLMFIVKFWLLVFGGVCFIFLLC